MLTCRAILIFLADMPIWVGHFNFTTVSEKGSKDLVCQLDVIQLRISDLTVSQLCINDSYLCEGCFLFHPTS